MIDLATFDLFDPVIQQDPQPWYDRIRDERGGIHFVEANGVFVVIDYELVAGVLREPEIYSSKFGTNREPPPPEVRAECERVMADGLPIVPTLLDNDPPSHIRFRRLVTRAFSPRMVAELRLVVEAVCDRLIASWIDRGRIDFVPEFAVPLPIAIIAHALNIPEDRRADFKRWSDDNTAAIGAQLPPLAYLATQRSIVEMQRFFVDQFELRRARPRDDLLTHLLNAHVGGDEAGLDDRPLEMPELVRIVQMLLVAGNETTTKLLTEIVRLAAEQPGGWKALREARQQLANVVEEGLRMASPSQGMYRLVKQDTELGGVAIPQGSRLVLLFAAANRDPKVFPDPHEFRIDRANARDHLAFGKGPHFCLGSNLARLEANVALEQLTDRLADVRLTDTNRFDYVPSFLLRGLTRLEIDFDPA